MSFNLEALLINIGYLVIFFYMISNGIISFPSSQLLYIISGYLCALNKLNSYGVIIIGALGNTIGNYILYEISRLKGEKYALNFISLLFPKEKIEKFIRFTLIGFEKKQYLSLFIGKLINPLKIIIPIPAGIIEMNRTIFIIITFVTSTIWAIFFTFLGYLFGNNLNQFKAIGIIMFLVALVVIHTFSRYIKDEIMKDIENIKEETKRETKTN